MPKIDIVPAFDERFQLEFSVPRKGAKPIEFTVQKVSYLPVETTEAFQSWAEDYKDEAGNAAVPPDRDTYLKLLELTLTPAKFEQVKKLTIGELRQIWDVWTSNTDIDLGESSASDAS